MAVLVPSYWAAYGPWNFLFLCDVALLLTLAAIWLENALLTSIVAVGITLPQFLWVFDFMPRGRIVDMAGYMFDSNLSLFARGLSLFHGWLPLLVLWMVARLGYDRRALACQSLLTAALLVVCYSLAPAPPAPVDDPDTAVNINYVHGLGFDEPQAWMPPLAWLSMLVVGLPLVVYLPTHLVLIRTFPRSGQSVGADAGFDANTAETDATPG